ncbi:MAG: GAF domain-containing protein [Anaerolineales bacterium]
MIKVLENYLRETCQLTTATWAVLADCEKDEWFVEAAYRLTRPRQAALVRFLGQPATSTWLDRALEGDEPSPLTLPEDTKLGPGRLYAFRLEDESGIILVAAPALNARERRMWRLLRDLIPQQDDDDTNSIYMPSLQADLDYDLPRAVDRILASFMRVVDAQGAWLGIRRGDLLNIVAQRNDARLAGLPLPIESNRLLRRAHRTLAEVSAVAGGADWGYLPNPVRKSTKYWICFPLVIGRRLIGAVTLWSPDEFPPQKIKTLRELSQRVAQRMEVIVTFNELTDHLRRLAMLNDFALAVSSAQNLDQIARRVFGYLARSFHTELISMYLPSMDGRLVREYRNREGKFSTQVAALASHRILPYLRGRILRLSESSPDFKPIYAAARSTLIVPLKYRSQIIGLLSMESTRPDSFSPYDEHLMVVIASHLAGLVEYGRLREEAEGRARNLGLIHEVVQQVIGLTDKKEVARITADLLAQYFAYELAAVVLTGDEIGAPVVGLGGSRSESLQKAFEQQDFSLEDSSMGRVFRSGESMLLNSAGQDIQGEAAQGLEAGSEMCVALKDGGRVLGLIDVRSSPQNAFTNNDLLAMESLAGVLATVVSSANHYERLQDTISKLRSAQVESQARLLAQQEAESRLVQAAKLVAVGEMAAGIAHELNNPLTTVTGFSELILDETPADAPHRADVEMVLQEALRARAVVRRLLDFARQGERTRAKCDLNEIIEDVLALTTHFIHTSGVRLEVALQEDLPWVSVDSNQLKQVFLNLVHNAVQAMPTGGSLSIKTDLRSRSGKPWAAVSIQDSGIGISPKDAERIFEPFYTTRGTSGGTGLGLSVTYGIVTDHGGTIEVASRPGEGSTFTVWLPY